MRCSSTAAAVLLASIALGVAACSGEAKTPRRADGDAAVSHSSSAATWQHALRLWQDRDVRAYAAWRAVDPASPEGREAERRLDEADTIYRSVISRLRSGETDAEASLAALPGALALAPIDPRLYLPLARALRDHRPPDLVRAAKYYLRFLASGPDGAEAEAAVREVSALELSSSPETATSVRATVRAFDRARTSGTPATATTHADGVPPAALVASGIAAGLALAALGALLAALLRPRGSSLARASEASPELHPAITYLVGCLRHELLKHRIGAASDALAALVRGEATPQQRAFLHGRLFGGEPLLAAWEGHLRAFERALGPRVDLRHRDRAFREAGRAIATIQRLEGALARDPTAAVPQLARAHATLRAFDRELAHLAARLVRTRVDEALLREVIDEVQSEYGAGLVALDEVRVRAPDEPIDVEVFRVDLVLVLKNLVRNAILAVGRDPAPRRLAVDVSVTIEPTGEEMVRIHVRDTSPETITEDSIRERRADRGLGLVSAALARYDAAISVEPGGDDFTKAVTLRFFRALGEADNDHSGENPPQREAA